MNWISPEECKQLLETKAAQVIDIRETWEYGICQMGAPNVPMHTVPELVSGWDKEAQYVIVCKTGRRAEAVANLLERDYGFASVNVLEGGITSWYEQHEPQFEMY